MYKGDWEFAVRIILKSGGEKNSERGLIMFLARSSNDKSRREKG